MHLLLRLILAFLAFLLVLLLIGPFLVPIPPLEGTVPPEQLADPDSRFVEINGLKVHYKIAGQENAWYPFYDVDLGEPNGDPQPSGGGFLREFTKGAVAVNPTQASLTIALPRRYTTLTGDAVEKVALPAKHGALLLLSDNVAAT